jgi:D-sedoheptulose 7-phosphate isomerase
MSDWNSWLDNYFARYKRAAFEPSIYKSLLAFRDVALSVRAKNAKMMFAGNGASASIAEHGAVDFTKQGKVSSVTFSSTNLITCFANDFGYDNWVAKAIEHYGRDGDAVILISVSGRSPSVVNAGEYAKSRGMPVVTFTGARPDNPLRALADVDFWFDSKAYNVVECVHMIWLTTVIDMVVGKAEYSVS